MLLRIAWRNLWRNKTRTFIVISAIAFSYGLMLWMFGIADDSYAEMEEAVVAAVGGQVLVHGEGYWDFPTGGQSIADVEQRRAQIEEIREVQRVAQRVVAYGLVGTARTNEGAQILGVRADDERYFYDVEGRLAEGEFFSDRDSPIVIGKGEANDLGVGIGDRVVITVTDLDGEVTRGVFFVDGIMEATPGEHGEGRGYVRFDELQQLLGYGDGATQLGVRLYDDDVRYSVASRIREQFEGHQLEVMTWDEAVPEFAALIEFDELFTYFYMFIIIFIVALGIMNTFLMAVMERVREIGLFSALGLTPKRIGLLILLETAVMTAVGMAIGLALGLMGHWWMVTYGLDISAIADIDMEMAGLSLDMMVIHSHIVPARWIGGSIAIFVVILISAAYPAWKATRLAPSEAMRFYE